MSENNELNHMREPEPARHTGAGGGGANGFLGLIGTVVVLALIIGMWGSETTVEVFGLELRPTWVVLIAYFGGLIAGKFPVRKR